MYLICQYETDGLALLLKALQVTPGSTYYFTFASGDYEVGISHHIMESTDLPIKRCSADFFYRILLRFN
jgi:hypothetical protein